MGHLMYSQKVGLPDSRVGLLASAGELDTDDNVELPLSGSGSWPTLNTKAPIWGGVKRC
jgi:hypothetical protein